MNILITLSYYSPHISGLTLYAKNIAEGLERKGHAISIVTVQHDKKLSRTQTINGVQVKRIPYLFRISKGFFIPSYLPKMYRELQKVNLVVIVLPQFEGIIIALIAFFCRKRVVCLYVCDIKLPDSFTSLILEKILFASHYITLWRAKKIITLTQDYARYSKVLPYFIKKLEYIYPPVSKLSINQTLSQDILKKLLTRKYKIGFLGRLSSEKGVEYLLEAIPLIRNKLQNDFFIVLAGPKVSVGEERYSSKIKSLIQKYKDYIVNVKELPLNQLGSFYSLLDVLVLPSVNSTDAFGMVQIEAMFLGVPVVATDLPGIRVPITETRMGEIVKIKDTSDLANKVVKIVFNNKYYTKQGKNVEKIFSFNDTIAQYEKVFKGIS